MVYKEIGANYWGYAKSPGNHCGTCSSAHQVGETIIVEIVETQKQDNCPCARHGWRHFCRDCALRLGYIW